MCKKRYLFSWRFLSALVLLVFGSVSYGQSYLSWSPEELRSGVTELLQVVEEQRILLQESAMSLQAYEEKANKLTELSTRLQGQVSTLTLQRMSYESSLNSLSQSVSELRTLTRTQWRELSVLRVVAISLAVVAVGGILIW